MFDFWLWKLLFSVAEGDAAEIFLAGDFPCVNDNPPGHGNQTSADHKNKIPRSRDFVLRLKVNPYNEARTYFSKTV